MYRSRDAVIFGVCRGLSDKLGINVSLLRLTLVILTIFTGFAPFGLIYLLAGILLPVEPREEDNPYYSRSFHKGFYDLKKDFDDLASRMKKTGRGETDREKEWERRFRQG